MHYTQAAIVTSTSTPASILMMICLTTSVGAFKLGARDQQQRNDKVLGSRALTQ